jgi:quinol monooxygenase YgiN
MVHSTIRMEMTPGKAKEALEVLCPLAERTRAEPGCIICRIYRDVQQEHTIMIEELWDSQEQLERHLCSSGYQRVLLVVEMAKGQPEIRFNAISHTSGFEAIAEARSHDGNLAHNH